MQVQYPLDSGPMAQLSEEEKKKRLDAMARIWQSDTEKRIGREGYRAFITAAGLDEYRYSVWLRFPEWERRAVVGQVITLQRSQSGSPEDPALFSIWRRDPLLAHNARLERTFAERERFNIIVRITPGGLGEGSKWAVVMPKEMIPRYKPGWPTQSQWVAWTRSFDWLSVAVGFIRAMLDDMEKQQR